MIRVGIVTNPLDPSTWQEHETHNVHELIAQEFPSWPSTARIYDLADFGDWTRAAAVADASVLSRRDVTPPGVPGPAHDAAVDRLGELPGPLLVIVPPADPITAIFAVVAIAVAVGAVFPSAPARPTTHSRAAPTSSA
jgi:hypothetical protein